MMETGIYIAAVIAVLMVLIWLVFLRKRPMSIKQVIKRIASEYRQQVVIPDGLDGFIELEHFLLTPHGLLVLDYRDVKGTIFPGEHLEQWPIMFEGKRTSISNPYSTMKHRLTAVKGLVNDVPIHGLLVFSDSVEFGNTPPENVVRVRDVYEKFNSRDMANKEQLVSSFRQRFNEIATFMKKLS